MAIKLWHLTNKKRKGYAYDVPVVSFEDLGVPFQWCGLLDLREAGVLTLGSTNDGKSGVVLKRPYADMSCYDFSEEIKNL